MYITNFCDLNHDLGFLEKARMASDMLDKSSVEFSGRLGFSIESEVRGHHAGQ